MKNDDFLRELGSIAATTRLKRISDALLHDGKRMYRELGMDIEPVVRCFKRSSVPLTVIDRGRNRVFASFSDNDGQ